MALPEDRPVERRLEPEPALVAVSLVGRIFRRDSGTLTLTRSHRALRAGGAVGGDGHVLADTMAETYAHLTKTHINSVAAVLQKAGLDSTQFRWHRPYVWGGPDLGDPRLVHEGTGFYFEFRWSEKWQKHAFSYSPAAEAAELHHNHGEVWEFVLEAVYKWANLLRAELEAPDLWKQFANHRDAVEALTTPESGSSEDEPFTPHEQRLLRQRIDQILEGLDQFGIDDPVAQRITREEFEALKEEVERLSRGKWVRLALGTVAKLIMSSVIGPDTADRLLQWISSGMEQLRALIAGA